MWGRGGEGGVETLSARGHLILHWDILDTQTHMRRERREDREGGGGGGDIDVAMP
jgi:hypothetical protein